MMYLRPGSRGGQRGFTLIEVLVALSVLALALGATIAAVTHYADATHYLRNKTFASWVAHNLMTEASLRSTWPAVGEKTEDEVTFADQNWAWRAKTEQTPDPTMIRVDVSVWPPGLKRDKAQPLFTLSGFFAKPGS